MRNYHKKLEKCEYIIPNGGDVNAYGFDRWLSTGETPLTLVAEDSRSSRWRSGHVPLSGSMAKASLIKP
jgi:hypothetical protein